MNLCLAKALWTASAIALINSSSTASPTVNAQRQDRLQPRKPAENPRPELWETSRKCNHGHLKETFFELFDDCRNLPPENTKDAASRRCYLMSFERHGEIYPNDTGADHQADAPAHHSDEFPAGYSLAGCSPALPASASPAGVDLTEDRPNSRDIFDGN
jgi:hypothetical protein